MNFNKTNLPFLYEDCKCEFGVEKGELIFKQVNKCYQSLVKNADFKNNSAIKEHLFLRLFPAMAYYKTLLDVGFNSSDSISYVKKETQKAAFKNQQKNKKLSCIPFAYFFYRLGIKKYMNKNFPKEGWRIEWIKCDNKEIHFNLHNCIYWELSQKYGCPELCQVYCSNDTTAFAGLLPKIEFKRNGTLGEGANYCDFHFINLK